MAKMSCARSYVRWAMECLFKAVTDFFEGFFSTFPANNFDPFTWLEIFVVFVEMFDTIFENGGDFVNGFVIAI